MRMIKRSIILFFVSLITTGLIVSAEEEEISMADILANSQDETLYSELFDRELYTKEVNSANEALKDYDLSGAPFALVYRSGSFPQNVFTQPLEEILIYAEQTCLPSYRYYYAVLVDDTVIGVEHYSKPTDSTKSLGLSAPIDRSWLARLFSTKVQSDFLGENYTIKEVYCFDNFWNGQGGEIYYVTDRGTFVKHYSFYNAEPLVFSEDEFQIYIERYNQYCDEHHHDLNGETLIGGITFAEFYNNMDTYMQKPTNRKIAYWWVYILIAAVVFLLLLFFWMLKSDKKQRKQPKP